MKPTHFLLSNVFIYYRKSSLLSLVTSLRVTYTLQMQVPSTYPWTTHVFNISSSIEATKEMGADNTDMLPSSSDTAASLNYSITISATVVTPLPQNQIHQRMYLSYTSVWAEVESLYRASHMGRPENSRSIW